MGTCRGKTKKFAYFLLAFLSQKFRIVQIRPAIFKLVHVSPVVPEAPKGGTHRDREIGMHTNKIIDIFDTIYKFYIHDTCAAIWPLWEIS